MAIDTIEGFTKEPEEVKYKGIDLTTWLQDNELVTNWYVEAYEIAPTTVRGFDLDGVSYIDIIASDEEGDVVDSEERWEMDDDWSNARFVVQRPVDVTEVTEDIVVGEGIGADNPNERIHRVNEGKFRIGIKNGEVGYTYRISTRFDTDANRTEQFHFPVEIIDVTDVE